MFRRKDKRHVVSIRDFSGEDIHDFLRITEAIKKDPGSYVDALAGKSMARIFYSDSTRTYETHGEAMERLGGRATLGFRNTQGTSVKKGETLASTLRMYERYGADVIVMRHPRDGSARYATDVIERALIINGGDGNNEHPTQNLMDLYTMKERFGDLNGITLLLFGDLRYGRTTRVVYPLSLFDGVRFKFLSHSDVSMPEPVKQYLDEKKIPYEECFEPSEFPGMIHDSDIAYGSRNQEERWPLEGTPAGDEMRRSVRDFMVISKSVLKRADPGEGLIVMHPLPKDKRHPCITDDVEDTPYCWYDRQAENGVYARMGILYSQFHDWWLDE